MNNQYWHDIWRNGQIGFNQARVNPKLLKHHSHLGALAERNLFLPLCGKSIDLLWFQNQGANVIGCELNQSAVEAFFEEQNQAYQTLKTDRYVQYHSGNITLLNGDLFALRVDDIPTIDIVYDRAALIALTPAMRKRYVELLATLLPPAAKILLITLSYQTSQPQQPPFSVDHQEVIDLYSTSFSLSLLEEDASISLSKHLRERDMSGAVERVYLLERVENTQE